MYCTKCGSENTDGNRFCENCGAELNMTEDKGAENVKSKHDGESHDRQKSSGSKKKLVISIVIAVVVVAAAVAALMMYLDNKNSAEYNAKIEEADAYMEELEYDKAETAYLEAIDIEPKESEAYVKVSDVYIVQEQYEEAEDILEKGQQEAGGKDIDKKLEQIRPYIAYRDYVQNELISENGMVEVENELTYTSIGSGLISAMIEDFDGDDDLELLTVSYGESTSTELIFSLYGMDDGSVELIDEVERKYSDGADYMNAEGSRFNVFLKEYEGKNFLVVGGEIIKENDLSGEWEGYGSIDILRIADLIEVVSESEWHLSDEDVTYTINDTEVAYYSSYTSPHDESEYNAELRLGRDAVVDEMSLFGFDGDRVSEIADGMTDMALAYDGDESERRICYIRHGVYNEDGSVNRTDAGITRYITDYTDLRGWAE